MALISTPLGDAGVCSCDNVWTVCARGYKLAYVVGVHVMWGVLGDSNEVMINIGGGASPPEGVGM